MCVLTDNMFIDDLDPADFQKGFDVVHLLVS